MGLKKIKQGDGTDLEVKRCTKCYEDRALAQFSRRKKRSGKWGTYSWCLRCVAANSVRHYSENEIKLREQRRLYYENNKAAVKQRAYLFNIYKQYGMTADKLQQMQDQQYNCCAICVKPFVGKPHIDHCHTSNKVRGLLCTQCNKGIGLFYDKPNVMRVAAAYLEKQCEN